jgi:hypothetical protein
VEPHLLEEVVELVIQVDQPDQVDLAEVEQEALDLLQEPLEL